MKKARTMLLESGLDHRFWGEAVLTANFVRNRIGTTVHGKTPLEMLTGKKPQVDELRSFGSTAYVHKPPSKRKKLDAVAEKGILLRYEPGTKRYQILRQSDIKTVLISKDVTFDESEKKQPSEELWESSTRESVSPKGDGLEELGGARDLSRVSPLTRLARGLLPRERPASEMFQSQGQLRIQNLELKSLQLLRGREMKMSQRKGRERRAVRPPPRE
jgi:hypothetical protein